MIEGYRFSDLKRMRIVNDRTQLHRLQRQRGFPRPIKLFRSAWWPKEEVEAWIAARKRERDEGGQR